MDKYRYVYQYIGNSFDLIGTFEYHYFDLIAIHCGEALHHERIMEKAGYTLISRDIWTGMTGSDGRDIYHRDHIVKDEYPFFDNEKPNYIGVVEWIFGSWQYVLHCVAPNKSGISEGVNCLIDDDGENGKHFRVIGTIYDQEVQNEH